MNDTYMSSPTKRRRSTKAEILDIKTAIYRVCEEDQPVTCRQVFYRLVSQGVIRKTEAEYKSTVIRLLGDMRRDDTIPYEWVAGNTRWMRKPTAYSSLSAMAESTARVYRRKIWDGQDVYVEVWTEKDALAGVLYDITSEYDVPLMVSRGFASHSFLFEAGKAIEVQNKLTFIYHFGDYDPSGIAIDRQIQNGLEEHAPDAEIIFERVAVTPRQIVEGTYRRGQQSDRIRDPRGSATNRSRSTQSRRISCATSAATASRRILIGPRSTSRSPPKSRSASF